LLPSTREATPPLPSRGDGVAASRVPMPKEVTGNSDDLISPEEKAAALAELHRALDATPTGGASLNGHARNPQPAPDLGAPTKAEGLAAFKRCIDAVNGKLGVLDSGATVPPPPDQRLVEFRARLSRLNTLAGSKLRGEVRMQAWQVIAKADSLADPRALPPAMLADLDAIERLGHAEAAE
jgi:hypothetical protein